jgi:hypothetical protein
MSRVSVQLLAILAFTFVLFVAWDFSQRVVMTFRLNQAEQELDQRLAEAEAARAQLRLRRQYVQTDQFVEEEIRRRRWARDGETIMIPLITPPPPPPLVVPTPVPTPGPPAWDELYDFLFGP